uniref:aromatic ring-hydroxylating oxygenase subunit alpha n=1 Tax=Pontibacterium sp. TaxID=2036026 RepID=UPI003514AEB7
MTSKTKTLELINQRKPRHALSRELYRDDEVYQQDLEQIWHKEWIFAGHTFEIEKAGEFMTIQVGDYPVVIVRDDSGDVRAFHNACRHRGSRVCAESKGKVAKLVCPYHKWTFGLDGKLLFAANMGEKFNNDDHGLMPVHCEVVNSYIYICVADEAPDFEQFRKDLSPFITPHNLEN